MAICFMDGFDAYAPNLDFAALETRVLASMISDKSIKIEKKDVVVAIDPAKDAGKAVALALVGRDAKLFIIDEIEIPITDFTLEVENKLKADVERRWSEVFGHHSITGTMTVDFEDEEALRRLMKEPVPTENPEAKPDNRKQRRIDAAKERQKPRGQRRPVRFGSNPYDTNRTKDWK